MFLPGKKQLDTFIDEVKDQLWGVFVIIAVIWIAFALDFVLPLEKWFALRPRSLVGVQGILTMPFVHDSFRHIASNTFTLIIMMVILAALRPKTWWKVMALITVIGGALTWLLGGSNTHHIGASGVVMGLVTFLIAPGGFVVFWWIYNRVTKQSRPYPLHVAPIPLFVSALVGFFYLKDLFFSLVPTLPTSGQSISWTAHWCGALAGVFIAFLLSRDADERALSLDKNIRAKTPKFT